MWYSALVLNIYIDKLPNKKDEWDNKTDIEKSRIRSEIDQTQRLAGSGWDIKEGHIYTYVQEPRSQKITIADVCEAISNYSKTKCTIPTDQMNVRDELISLDSARKKRKDAQGSFFTSSVRDLIKNTENLDLLFSNLSGEKTKTALINSLEQEFVAAKKENKLSPEETNKFRSLLVSYKLKYQSQQEPRSLASGAAAAATRHQSLPSRPAPGSRISFLSPHRPTLVNAASQEKLTEDQLKSIMPHISDMIGCISKIREPTRKKQFYDVWNLALKALVNIQNCIKDLTPDVKKKNENELYESLINLNIKLKEIQDPETQSLRSSVKKELDPTIETLNRKMELITVAVPSLKQDPGIAVSLRG